MTDKNSPFKKGDLVYLDVRQFKEQNWTIHGYPRLSGREGLDGTKALWLDLDKGMLYPTLPTLQRSMEHPLGIPARWVSFEVLTAHKNGDLTALPVGHDGKPIPVEFRDKHYLNDVITPYLHFEKPFTRPETILLSHAESLRQRIYMMTLIINEGMYSLGYIEKESSRRRTSTLDTIQNTTSSSSYSSLFRYGSYLNSVVSTADVARLTESNGKLEGYRQGLQVAMSLYSEWHMTLFPTPDYDDVERAKSLAQNWKSIFEDKEGASDRMNYAVWHYLMSVLITTETINPLRQARIIWDETFGNSTKYQHEDFWF